MKLQKTVKTIKVRSVGNYAEARDRFLVLKQLDMATLKPYLMVVPLEFRPYISKIAKAAGAEYLTLNLRDGNMLVLRYTAKNLVKKKKV